MSENINQFWNLLLSSGLIASPAVEPLVAEAKANKSLEQVADLVDWLVQKNAVTRYQGNVLANGQATDFLFGQYRLLDEFLTGQANAAYHAVHRSGYQVRVQFLPGKGQDDVRRWVQIEQRAARLADCDQANLVACFESIKLPQHRMVVSELPTGKPLVELMPGKARLPFKQACQFGLQLAEAVAELHRKEEPHHAICPASIRLLTSDRLRLDVDPFDFEGVSPGPQNREVTSGKVSGSHMQSSVERYQAAERSAAGPTGASAFAADMFSVGAVLFRMVAGRDCCDLDLAQRSELLAKRDLPAWLVRAVDNLTGSVPGLRMSAGQLVDLLKDNGVQSAAPLDSDSRAEFRELILQGLVGPDFESEGFDFELEVPELERVRSVDPSVAIDVVAANQSADPQATSDRIAKAKASIQHREKLRWLQPVIVLASCLIVGAVFSSAYYYGGSSDGGAASDDVTAVDAKAPATRQKKVISARRANVEKSDGAVSSVRQKLVQDDGQTIWETPTQGARLDLEYLPPAPKIVLTVKPKQLLATGEGQRLRKAMGAGFSTTLGEFTEAIGMPVDELESVLVSFHQNDSEDYQWFAVVTGGIRNRKELLSEWSSLSQQQSIDGEIIYKDDDGLAFFMIDEPPVPAAADPSTNETEGSLEASQDASDVTVANGQSDGVNGGRESRPVRFLVGPPELVKSVVDVGRGFPVAGALQRLQEFSDQDRHLNLLYLRPSLFNDRGQNWMGANLLDFNRQLSELLPDEVKGGLLSLHIDGGNYIEAVFDRSVDIKVNELKQRIQRGIDLRLQGLFELNRRIPADDHWKAVQRRYEKMISQSLSRVRWGVEDRELIGNAWLPPMASHNLIAASELVAAFRLAAVDPSAQQKAVPQNLAQLLQQTRDLDIANPPDLNVLMSDLETEVKSDYKALPFKWRIILQGADLEKDGITKNQRPGPLKIGQKSFAEILTTIVVSANPDKNISGPEDPACRLIWVIAADPDFPGQSAVLITTRGAAKEKAYQLPAPFVKQ